MADMMMAAGIDASRDVDLDRSDLMLAVEIGEAAGDRLSDRDRARGGERAVVEARAGDDVADEADIGGGEIGFDECLPYGKKIVAPHMRQHQILMMAHSQLIEAVAFGKLGDRAHLCR